MKRTIQAIAAYAGILSICVLFTLFLDGIAGSYLLGIMLLAPVISLTVLLFAKLRFKASLELGTSLCDKGEKVTATLSVPQSRLFFLSVFTVEIKNSYHLSAEDNVVFRIGGRKKDALRQRVYDCDFFGIGEVFIANVIGMDFLGLISFKLNIDPCVCKVRILPLQKDMNALNDLGKALSDTAAYNDSEETNDKAVFTAGMPGYEHREYAPGDPLKMVNWKLSAKRDTLLVRKLEGYAIDKQIMVMDSKCSACADKKRARYEEQLLVEGFLSLAMFLVRTEVPVIIYIKFKDNWEKIIAETPENISRLRYKFADFTFTVHSDDRLPIIDNEHTSGYVLFSACPNMNLSELLDGQKINGMSAEIVTSSSDNSTYGLYWRVLDNCGETDIKKL